VFRALKGWLGCVFWEGRGSVLAERAGEVVSRPMDGEIWERKRPGEGRRRNERVSQQTFKQVKKRMRQPTYTLGSAESDRSSHGIPGKGGRGKRKGEGLLTPTQGLGGLVVGVGIASWTNGTKEFKTPAQMSRRDAGGNLSEKFLKDLKRGRVVGPLKGFFTKLENVGQGGSVSVLGQRER